MSNETWRNARTVSNDVLDAIFAEACDVLNDPLDRLSNIRILALDHSNRAQLQVLGEIRQQGPFSHNGPSENQK